MDDKQIIRLFFERSEQAIPNCPKNTATCA